MTTISNIEMSFSLQNAERTFLFFNLSTVITYLASSAHKKVTCLLEGPYCPF